MRKAAVVRSVEFVEKQREKIKARSKALKLIPPPECKVIFEYFSLDEGPDAKFVRKQIFEDGTFISTSGMKCGSESELYPLMQRSFFLKRSFARYIMEEINSHIENTSRFTKYNRVDDWFIYHADKKRECSKETSASDDDDQSRLDNQDPLLVLAADRWTDFHHLEVYRDFSFVSPSRYILACDGKRLEADVSLVSLMAHGDFLIQYEKFGSFEMMEKDFIKITYAVHGEDWEKNNNIDFPAQLKKLW